MIGNYTRQILLYVQIPVALEQYVGSYVAFLHTADRVTYELVANPLAAVWSCSAAAGNPGSSRSSTHVNNMTNKETALGKMILGLEYEEIFELPIHCIHI